MAIAKILPITAQGVIPVPFGQGTIMTKGFDDAGQIVVQYLAITPLHFTLEIALELGGSLNLPHSDRP